MNLTRLILVGLVIAGLVVNTFPAQAQGLDFEYEYDAQMQEQDEGPCEDLRECSPGERFTIILVMVLFLLALAVVGLLLGLTT